MKIKLYFFLAIVVIMLCTINVDAQRFSLLEKAVIPETGVTYVIMNASTNQYISCKYGGNGGLLEVMDDNDVLWQIEATGEQTPAGYDLWYLYSVGAGKYVQEVDLEGNEGLDGYDVYSYNGFNWGLGDKTTAMKVVIEKGVPGEDAEENEVWRKNGPSTGFVISRQNIVYWGESPKMMKFGRQVSNVAWEPYNEDVAWQFWTVKDNGPQTELEQLVDECSKVEFVGGTDPGFYSHAEVDAYTASFENARMLLETGANDDELQAAIADLRAKRKAVEDAMIPLSEGYYFIVSAFDDYLNEFGHEKGVWDDTVKNLISSKNFDPENVIFVWYVTPNTNSDAEDNEFWVQNYVSGHYVGHGANWYSSTTPLTPNPAEPQNIRQYVSGKWYWGNRTYHNTSYCVQESWGTDHLEAKDIEDALRSFGQWNDDSTRNSHFNLWYLRRISDEQMVDFAEKKAQVERTKRMDELISQAQELYTSLFSYKQSDEGLIKVAGGNWALDFGGENTNIEGNQIVFSRVRGQGQTGTDDYKFLIDGRDDTYMQGSGCIQIDISQTPQQIVTFTYTTRCASMEHGTANQHQWGVNERPNKIEIYASNDTVDGNWILVGGTELGAVTPAERNNPFPPVSYTLDMGDTYGYLCYKVLTNANGGNYFTLGEFQMYPCVVDETTSKYYIIEGMKAKAEALIETAKAKAAIANEATDADIAALENVINAINDPTAPILYPIVYIVDGKTYNIELYAEGEQIVPMTEPYKEGCIFNGWSEIPSAMGTEKITVSGTFIVDEEAKTIFLDKHELLLTELDGERLIATVTPSIASQKVAWSSSDTTIVKVNNDGTVTPLDNGSAMIIATTIDGIEISDTCYVTVDFKVAGISIDKRTLTFNRVQPDKLTAVITPDKANQAIVWSSSDTTVVTVSVDGTVKPVGNGSAIVTATSVGNPNFMAACTVTVDIANMFVANTTQTALSVTKMNELTEIENVQITIDGNVYTFTDDNFLITGLSPNKVYYVKVVADINGNKWTEEFNETTKDINISCETTNTTQTTATIQFTDIFGDAEVVSRKIDDQVVDGNEITLTGLKPATQYNYEYVVQTEGNYTKKAEISFETKDITVNFDHAATPTTLNITGVYDAGDATVTRASFNSEEELDEIVVDGLDPGRTYTYLYYVTTKEGGTKAYEAKFATTALELTAPEAKVVTIGDVVVSAKSNITEEENVNVGFEWRRFDWPDEIATKRGAAFIYEGKIEGSIRNLNTDKFWKIRPYFQSKGGTYYYGDWVTVDPSDPSYFEPTIHTYSRTEVEGNTALVKGYALGGSDQVQEQGFKYWEIIPSSSSPKYPQATEVPSYAKTVTASGQLMTAELPNLQYEMEYRYVAFVTTADGKTYYGEEQSIKIDDPTGISDAVAETPASGDIKVYTLTGALIYSGTEDKMHLEKGLYIIRQLDGKTQKVIIR